MTLAAHGAPVADDPACVKTYCTPSCCQVAQASVAIDGSKFKAVNNRDKNFTRAIERRTLTVEKLDAVADRGYFNSEEIRSCEEAGITVTLPKPMTSNAKAEGRFGRPAPPWSRWPHGRVAIGQSRRWLPHA
jgi:hypothetical protein